MLQKATMTMWNRVQVLREEFINEHNLQNDQIWFHKFYWGLRLNDTGFDLVRDKMVCIYIPCMIYTLDVKHISIAWYYGLSEVENYYQLYLSDKEAAMWLKIHGIDNIVTWAKNYMI